MLVTCALRQEGLHAGGHGKGEATTKHVGLRSPQQAGDVVAIRILDPAIVGAERVDALRHEEDEHEAIRCALLRHTMEKVLRRLKLRRWPVSTIQSRGEGQVRVGVHEPGLALQIWVAFIHHFASTLFIIVPAGLRVVPTDELQPFVTRPAERNAAMRLRRR